MPRFLGKIYRIFTNDDEPCYIGSTKKERLATRLNEHKSFGKKYTKSKFYAHYRDRWNAAKIELLAEVPYDFREELLAVEKEYIQKYNLTYAPGILNQRLIHDNPKRPNYNTHAPAAPVECCTHCGRCS